MVAKVVVMIVITTNFGIAGRHFLPHAAAEAEPTETVVVARCERDRMAWSVGCLAPESQCSSRFNILQISLSVGFSARELSARRPPTTRGRWRQPPSGRVAPAQLRR